MEDLDIKQLPELERYMLHRIYELNKNFKNYFKSYDFHNLYKELLNFCTVDLSSFYFDIRKDVLYCNDLDSKKRKDCIVVLNIILECLLKWFAPIFVFTTEEIYSLVQKSESSIHESLFPVNPQRWEENKLKKIKFLKIFFV